MNIGNILSKVHCGNYPSIILTGRWAGSAKSRDVLYKRSGQLRINSLIGKLDKQDVIFLMIYNNPAQLLSYLCRVILKITHSHSTVLIRWLLGQSYCHIDRMLQNVSRRKITDATVDSLPSTTRCVNKMPTSQSARCHL